MADALVSIVLEQLCSFASGEIEEKMRLFLGVREKVERLKSNLLAIKAVLVDAEERQFKDEAVKQWIIKLKAACYDIEDVLDEWYTHTNTSEIEGGDKHQAAYSKPKGKVSSLIRSCFSCGEVGFRHDVACKIRTISKRLKDIAIERNNYGFALLKDAEHVERSMTASVIDVMEIKGRVNDQNKIKGMLLGDRESTRQLSNLHIISLIGMGGIGKTTLAKLVFNDNEVDANFEKRIWVCVSDPFDDIRVAKAILESLTHKTPDLVELQNILQQLQEYLKGKKFLLVLDDVWEEDRERWIQLKHSLKCGSPGSKILVTTRKDSVANMMDCIDVHKLGLLPKEECWSIFREVAFNGRSSSEECERLEGIGRKIVERCKGLPLAVKSLAGVLRFKKSIQEWQSVLDSKLWEVENVHQDVMAPLLLSYYDLAPSLRHCFSLCAIFPKDYKIEKKNLIELWMAQGYLKKTSNKTMYRVGEEHFQSLATRSFFQDFEMDHYCGSIIACKMHDMVHDLAQFLTRDECLIVDINNNPEELKIDYLRHLMVAFPKSAIFPNSFYDMKKLRSFLMDSKRFGYMIKVGLSDLFNQLTCLRSLSLSYCGILKIPSNINKLVHLRQLDLSSNVNLRELPETICELYNLQVLDVSFCEALFLPRGIGNLINLSHLNNRKNILAGKPLPKGIGKLSCLEKLDEFIIGSDSDSCRVSDLRNLNCLQGELFIKGLENVGNIKEVEQAQLKKKTQISSLYLAFGLGEADIEWRQSHEEEMLEALEPPPNLEDLSLYDCQAIRLSPRWMTSLSSLRRLWVYDGRKCKVLPPVGRLPWLEHLEISGMDNVERVGVEFLGIQTDENASMSSSMVAFPKLLKLRFDRMENWVDWVDCSQISIMPCLQSLTLCWCRKLKAVPSCLLQNTTLKILDIAYCPNLTQVYKKGTGEDWHSISHIPNIKIW